MKKNTTKLFAMLLLFCMAVVAITSCGIVTADEYKFGLATIEGSGSDVAAAVILDSSDRIALVRIDEIGKGSDISKKDLGDSYGMASGSSIGAEWYEQIADLERALVGMKAEDLTAIKAEGADITASCTVGTDNYIAAVVKAIEIAKSSEESFKSRVDNLAISLSIFAGRAGEDGNTVVAVSAAALSRGYTMAKASAFFGATVVNCRLGFATLVTNKNARVAASVLIDENDKIVLVKIDEFDFSDERLKSKKDLGSDYGMYHTAESCTVDNPDTPHRECYASHLAEWDDQISYLENSLVGKNANEVGRVETNGADISAGCTVAVDYYTAAVVKAISDAKYAEAFTAVLDKLELSLKMNSTGGDTLYINTAVEEYGRTIVAKDGTASAVEELRFGFATYNTDKGLVAAAVVINSSNRVVSVKIDEIDLSYGNNGSKKDLGYGYNMAASAEMGEWFEQIEYLEGELIRKTYEELDQIKNGSADISAGCTVYVGNYNLAVLAAINDAKAATAFEAHAIDARDLRLSLTAEGSGSYTITATAALYAGMGENAATPTAEATKTATKALS